MGAVTDGTCREPALDAAAVSVVVPAHRADDGFRAGLASVMACRPPAGEVIVVADGEREACGAIAAGHAVRFLATRGGEGPAVARNLGARSAAGEVVLFLDADVVVPADLVGRVARLFAEEPELDGLFGSYDAAPGAPGVVSAFRNLLHHHVHQTSRREAVSFWSGCGALRREAFAASGGFDETYRRPCVEDIDLGSRLVRAGRKIRLERSLQVKHLKRWRLASMVVADVRDRALPWTEIILRERRLPRDLNLRPAHRVGAAASVACAAALAAVPAFPVPAALAAAASAAVVLAANRSFYRLLLEVRGPAFLAAALPLHVLHYLCAAAGLAAGLARHARESARRWRSAAPGDASAACPAPVRSSGAPFSREP
jgi:glycosyltransferase involved in cell wall biosynthesis